ncbi:MAG: heme lyase CcmF/NrfE family subunit, partial [Rickettsiales bacterium]|nr:heme lyase CcmF/NrfE family subunit [Rickettsiales bacterium]
MMPEFGVFFLIIALLAALLQAAYLLPVALLKRFLPLCLAPAAWVQAFSVCLSFLILVHLRLNSDFSVLNVVQHSNLNLPVLYKIVGSWGNHEGSMLLWVMVLAVFGACVAFRPLPSPGLQPLVVAVQAGLSAGVLLFILFTSNPFARVFPPTLDGEALNPLLQDMALAMHPPLLYLGYVGFSIVFSFACAALLLGRMDEHWARAAHPWIVVAWSFLTLGIGLGSWWAYRVLGWGGFWFWDPVENASLLPWLSGTALMHANVVLKKRGMLRSWVLLLSILTFGLSLMGTFLVRSGLLTSVHSFASDPARGSFILLYMLVVLGGALLLYALRGPRLVAAAPDGMLPVSREGMIVINNLFLLTACATVFLGTAYPIVLEWMDGSKLTVGPSFYNVTFLPLVAVPLFFAGLTPFLPWQRAEFSRVRRQLSAPFAGMGVAALLVLAAGMPRPVLSASGIGIAVWLAACSVQWLRKAQGRKGAWPVFLGHMGAALVVAGVTGAGLWAQE